MHLCNKNHYKFCPHAKIFGMEEAKLCSVCSYTQAYTVDAYEPPVSIEVSPHAHNYTVL